MTGTFVNAVYPNEGQIKEMQAEGPDSAIVMVNLLKFRDHAQYRDGRETKLTGREAYDLYAREVTKLVVKHGGRILYAGDTTFLALGEALPLWDEVALAMYPTRRALFEMSTSKEWMAIAVHREAGLEGQLNIETTPSFLPTIA